MDYIFYLYILGLLAFSIFSGKILAPVLLWILGKTVAKTKTSLDDRTLKEIKGPLESSFFIFIIYAAVHYFPIFKSYIAIAERYIAAVIIALAAYLALKIAKAIFRWYYEEGHKNSKIKVELSLLPLLYKGTQLAVIFIGLMLFLNEFGFNITAILAITSVVGIVVGLASQETLANVFAGLAMQLDRQHHYGDYLRLPSGEVTRLRKVGMRSTRLYDLWGNVIVSSNSEFAKTRVAKVGKANEKADLSVSFEAPISAGVSEIIDSVSKGLKKEISLGLVEKDSVRCFVSRVKAPGWYEALAIVKIKDLSHSNEITDKINRLIMETVSAEIGKKK